MSAPNYVDRRYTHWWLDRSFLFVGRMDLSKGIVEICTTWLKLFDRFRDGCPALWLVGGTPEEVDNVRAVIGESRLVAHEASGKIAWWGYLDAAGISTLLLKSYVLLMHSQYEPGGRVVLEAMAQGVPVIATPHGFALDLIDDWHGGFLVPFGDSEMLLRRMEHFTLQPLLRHAMGAAARSAAGAAFARWDFVESHLNAYDSLVSGVPPRASDGKQVTDGCKRASVSESRPKHFEAVFPFEAEIVDRSIVRKFVREAIDVDTSDFVELTGKSGRSRLWTFRNSASAWIVKHPHSTYRVRPMWDPGFRGDIAERLRKRLDGELLGTARCASAPIVALDREHGLYLRRLLEPAQCEDTDLERCIDALVQFHGDNPQNESFAWLRSCLAHDWRRMSSDDVANCWSTVHERFEKDDRPYHAWQPLSLRLNWRWLELGLKEQRLQLPSDLNSKGIALIVEQAEVAMTESTLPLGWNHGDAVPEHFRLDERGNVVLIDCERTYPGFFGYDPARFACGLIDTQSDNAAVDAVIRIARALLSRNLGVSMFRSWLLWTVLYDLCRAEGLLDQPSSAIGRRRWSIIDACNFTSIKVLSP